MNRIKSLSLLLVLGVIFFACGKSSQDPLGVDQGNDLSEEGRLTTTLGSNGPNLVVTWSNADSACQTINEAVFTIFPKAGFAASNRPVMTEPVRMNGDYNGYAIVDGTSELVGKITNYDLKAIFYDYSDDGLIYFGGSLRFQGPIDKQGVIQDLHLNDEIKFAGPYRGFIEYNHFKIPIDNMGNMISIYEPCEIIAKIDRAGNVIFRSGGNIFPKNPYPVVVNIILVTLPNGEEEEVYICDPDYSQ